MPNATVRATARTTPEETNETVSPQEDAGRVFDLAYSNWLFARGNDVRCDPNDRELGRRHVLNFSNAERALFMTPACDSGDLWKKVEAIEFAAVEELASGPLVHSNLLLGLGAFKNDLLAILDPRSRYTAA